MTSNNSSQPSGGNFLLDIQPTRQSLLNQKFDVPDLVEKIHENAENEEDDINVPDRHFLGYRDHSEVKQEGIPRSQLQKKSMLERSMDSYDGRKLSFQQQTHLKMSAAMPGGSPQVQRENSMASSQMHQDSQPKNRRSPFYQASVTKYSRKKTIQHVEQQPISFMESIQKQEMIKMKNQGMVPSEKHDTEISRINHQLSSNDNLQRTASLDNGEL